MNSIDYAAKDFHFDPDWDLGLRSRLRSIYNKFRQPVHTRIYGHYVPNTLHRVSSSSKWVLWNNGIPRAQTRSLLTKLSVHPIQHIVVLGCGTAWDFGHWFRLRPLEIIGIDLYNFARAWQQVEQSGRQWGINVRFIQADLAKLRELNDCWADVVLSDAVFEHCTDLSSVLKEAVRIMRPSAIMYASYGPIWYSAGGDHFSLRCGLANTFNHLLLDKINYQRFFEANVKSIEDPQNGGRYVPLEMFSKLSSSQYLDLYNVAGLRVEAIAIQVSSVALEFRNRFPKNWANLMEMYPQLLPEDYFICGHFVYLRKYMP